MEVPPSAENRQNFGESRNQTQVYLYNLIQDVIHAGNKEVKRMGHKRQYKHEIRMNENLAIGLFKESFMRIWLEKSERKRSSLLKKLQTLMEKYILPIHKMFPNNDDNFAFIQF